MGQIAIPLERLIGFAITDRTGFRQFVDDMERTLFENQPSQLPDINVNEAYIRGKIDDISQHQFADPDRYLIELVANAMDAGADTIDIQMKKGRRIVRDNGAGMNFEDLVYDLSLPFYSEKTGEGTIGRFGLGFFSTLRELSNGGRVLVRTRKNGERYQVVYSRRGDSINATFSPYLGRIDGTEVVILTNGDENRYSDNSIGKRVRNLILGSPAKRTVEDYVRYVDLERYKIRVNGRQINRPFKKGRLARTYHVPFQGETIRVHLHYGNKNGVRAVLSGGVMLRSQEIDHDIITDYPLSFELVEGRTQLINTPRLREAQRAVAAQALIPYTREIRRVVDKKSEKYSNWKLRFYDLPELRTYVKSASREELLDFLSIEGEEIPQDREITAATILGDDFLSDYYILTGNYHRLTGALFDSPYIKGLNDIVRERAIRKVDLEDLTTEELSRYGINPTVLQRYASRYQKGVTVYFMDLSPNTLSPYGATPWWSEADETRVRKVDTYSFFVNQNHRVFRDESYEAQRAKNWFFLKAVAGAQEAEDEILGEVYAC